MAEATDNKQPVQEWAEFPVLVEMDFSEQMEKYEEICATIKDLEQQKKDLAADIQSAMIVANVKKVSWNQLPVSIRTGRTPSKISATILAEKGVEPSVIKAATVPGTLYDYIYVQRPKNPVEGEKGGYDPYADPTE